MDFDTGDLDDVMAGLDGLVQVAQNPQLHILTNSIQDSYIEPGESIVSLASQFTATHPKS